MSTAKAFNGTAATAVMTVLIGGCSFAFVDGPPTAHRNLPYFECTSGRSWPIVDTVLGAGAAVNAAGVASQGSGDSTKTLVAVAAGEAALFIASAVYGYGKTSECREAKEELIQRVVQHPYGPSFGPRPAPIDPWLHPAPGSFRAPHPPPPGAPYGAPYGAPAAPPPTAGASKP